MNSQASRCCSKCGVLDPIDATERLWPAGWACAACGASPVVRQGIVCLAPELDEVNEGFELHTFDLLAEIEPSHFWFVARNELIEDLVRTYAAHAGRVLEIGCGTGFVLEALKRALPKATIAGSELHSRGLKHARLRHQHGLELLQMDARQSGLSGALDLVGAFDVLEHIPEDEAVLAEIYRMLRPGGRLIATVPQHPALWSQSDDVAHHQRRYKIGELSTKAKAAGFRIVYTTSFVVLLLPLMAASRLLSMVKGGKADHDEVLEAEFRLSPSVNAALLKVCRIEYSLRRLGLWMPFGGSQVMIAERPVAR